MERSGAWGRLVGAGRRAGAVHAGGDALPVFGLGSIWLTELIIYMHATLFLLAAAWTLREGGHVRVDILLWGRHAAHQGADRSRSARLLLLLPFTLALLWLSLARAPQRSWAILERSQETSGIPAVFLLKKLIPLFAAMMALQGVSQAMRARWNVLAVKPG